MDGVAWTWSEVYSGGSQISSWKETDSGSQALSCCSVCDYSALPRFCEACFPPTKGEK